MAVRLSWEGHLRLSLVTCPVALYPATTEADTVRFNLINPETNNRIRMKTVDAGTGEEVSRGDLVKGFVVAKIRAGEVDRPALLRRALSPGAVRQDRYRSLRRDPRVLITSRPMAMTPFFSIAAREPAYPPIAERQGRLRNRPCPRRRPHSQFRSNRAAVHA